MQAPGPDIPYADIARRVGLATETDRHMVLAAILSDAWVSVYSGWSGGRSHVLRCADKGFSYLFDTNAGPNGDERLVAVYGLSAAPAGARDASRMKGFLGGGLVIAGKGTFDKGHFMAHSMGGGLDINLFPQRPDLNRGWSDQGRQFRAMERHLANNRGTFGFARPMYSDRSWVPTHLEYGVLLATGLLWVERFDN